MSTDQSHAASETNARAEAEAAQAAAQQALTQAQETAKQAVETIKMMSPERLAYLGCMVAVVVCMLVFDMASFAVATPDVAVSETVAAAQRSLEARMNSWSYSAFTSTLWGKLAWLSALSGIGLMIASAMGKLRAGWVPLALIGAAGLATLMMMLLFFVGFPDLSAYSDASCSATLLGYWVPLLAAAGGTAAAAKPVFFAK